MQTNHDPFWQSSIDPSVGKENKAKAAFWAVRGLPYFCAACVYNSFGNEQYYLAAVWGLRNPCELRLSHADISVGDELFLLNRQSNELASDFSTSSSLNLQELSNYSEGKAFFVLMWQNISWPIMSILWLCVSLWFSNKGFYIHNKNMRGTILFTLLINYVVSTEFEIKMLF